MTVLEQRRAQLGAVGLVCLFLLSGCGRVPVDSSPDTATSDLRGDTKGNEDFQDYINQ